MRAHNEHQEVKLRTQRHQRTMSSLSTPPHVRPFQVFIALLMECINAAKAVNGLITPYTDWCGVKTI